MRDGYFVYVLSDPDTNDVRYIGCTRHPVERSRQWAKGQCMAPGSLVAEWVSSLIASGKRPKFEVVFTAEGWHERKAAKRVEKELIDDMVSRHDGHLILNQWHNRLREPEMFAARTERRHAREA